MGRNVLERTKMGSDAVIYIPAITLSQNHHKSS
jgi:hypothetical protein